MAEEVWGFDADLDDVHDESFSKQRRASLHASEDTGHIKYGSKSPYANTASASLTCEILGVVVDGLAFEARCGVDFEDICPPFLVVPDYVNGSEVQ